MAIPDPPKAGSPFSPLWTGGWNPKTPKINNFFIPEITLRGGYLIIFLLPTRFLFHARFRFERRNPRLERRCLSLGCHGGW